MTPWGRYAVIEYSELWVKPDYGISKAPICLLLPLYPHSFCYLTASCFYVKERACLASQMILSDRRHQKMNRSPRSPTGWRVINLSLKCELNATTTLFIYVTALSCNTTWAGDKCTPKAYWWCVKNWDAIYCMHHTNVRSKRMQYVCVKHGAVWKLLAFARPSASLFNVLWWWTWVDSEYRFALSAFYYMCPWKESRMKWPENNVDRWCNFVGSFLQCFSFHLYEEECYAHKLHKQVLDKQWLWDTIMSPF